MVGDPAQEPEADYDDDLPLADELNKRADALIERIDKHLARRGPPEHPREITGIAAARHDAVPE